MSEMLDRVARAIMLHDNCGCTLEGGERVFCHDERLPEHVLSGRLPFACECLSGARAAIEAMREPTTAAGEIACLEAEAAEANRDLQNTTATAISWQKRAQKAEAALDRIERLGHRDGPGFGFTCAEIAAEALGRPLRRKPQPSPQQSFVELANTAFRRANGS